MWRGGFGHGVAFRRGHTQKHNTYISEAVFVGKYRHGKGPWLWDQWVRTAQHGTEAILWLCGLDWMCREWCLEHCEPTAVQNVVITWACLQSVVKWKGCRASYADEKGGLTMNPNTSRDTAMTLIHWWYGFCLAGPHVNVSEGSMGLVVPSEIYGWLEYWGEKCGLVWLEGTEEM